MLSLYKSLSMYFKVDEHLRPNVRYGSVHSKSLSEQAYFVVHNVPEFIGLLVYYVIETYINAYKISIDEWKSGNHTAKVVEIVSSRVMSSGLLESNKNIFVLTTTPVLSLINKTGVVGMSIEILLERTLLTIINEFLNDNKFFMLLHYLQSQSSSNRYYRVLYKESFLILEVYNNE